MPLSFTQMRLSLEVFQPIMVRSGYKGDGEEVVSPLFHSHL